MQALFNDESNDYLGIVDESIYPFNPFTQGNSSQIFSQNLRKNQIQSEESIHSITYNKQFKEYPKKQTNSINKNKETTKKLSQKKQINTTNKKKSIKKSYSKNINGYIVKTAIRQFINLRYENVCVELCNKYGSNYDECKQYYCKYFDGITGPSHFSLLLTYQNEQTKQKKAIINTFRHFLPWFLKERYIRHLLLEGKMHERQIYIDHKNNNLLQRKIVSYKLPRY